MWNEHKKIFNTIIKLGPSEFFSQLISHKPRLCFPKYKIKGRSKLLIIFRFLGLNLLIIITFWLHWFFCAQRDIWVIFLAHSVLAQSNLILRTYSYLHRHLSQSSLSSRQNQFLQSLIFKRRHSVLLCPFGVRAKDVLLMVSKKKNDGLKAHIFFSQCVIFSGKPCTLACASETTNCFISKQLSRCYEK